MKKRIRLFLGLTSGLSLIPAVAQAQEATAAQSALGEDPSPTDNDALANSVDAFGQTVGNESTGLYSSSRVRGFSPIDAGNVRIDGLYYDQVGGLSARLRYGNAIRVGMGTRGYALPAPTGVVEYSVNRPTEEPAITFDLNTDFGGQSGGSVEASFPLGRTDANLFAGAGVFSRVSPANNHFLIANFASVLTYHPFEGAELLAFSSAQILRDNEPRPRLFPAEDELPQEMNRSLNLTQPWADSAYNNSAWGVIAKAPFAGMKLEVGAFLDQRHDQSKFTDLLNDVSPDGDVGERVIVAEIGRRTRSASGEFRISRRLARGHRLTASLRLRERHRLYGATGRQSLGPTTLAERDEKPMPEFTFGEQRQENVNQLMAGLAYSGAFGRLVFMDAGVMRTDYRKHTLNADVPATPSAYEDQGLFWNAGVSVLPHPNVTLFASFVRGMEEAREAPNRAVNAAEAPAAVYTQQEEAGLRYVPSPNLSLTVGAFQISKPYFNLDANQFYRELGTLGSRGIELSLIAQPHASLTTLFGMLVADPAVTGETATQELIGSLPVAMAEKRAVTNVNWRPENGESDWSFDLAFEYVGRRAANSENSLFVPAYGTFDLGLRYRANWDGASFLLRGKLENVFDAYGWDVSTSGGLTYSDPRKFTLQLVTRI